MRCQGERNKKTEKTQQKEENHCIENTFANSLIVNIYYSISKMSVNNNYLSDKIYTFA